LGSGLHEQRRVVARRDFTWYLLALMPGVA
jgi:hypothetical protein